MRLLNFVARLMNLCARAHSSFSFFKGMSHITERPAELGQAQAHGPSEAGRGITFFGSSLTFWFLKVSQRLVGSIHMLKAH